MGKFTRKVETGESSNSRTIRLYMKEIVQIPLLTVEEEKELGRRIRAGDSGAVQKLVEANLRFVIKIARKFTRNPEQFLDLINAGNVGLIEAARRFDPDMNVRFISYAIWWIRQSIFRYLAETTHAFRVPPRLANILYRTGSVLRATVRSERPDKEQLALLLKVRMDELDTALRLLAGPVSLDEPISEDGDLLLQDRLEQTVQPSPEAKAVIQSTHHHLAQSIRILKPIEQDIIRLRFGFNDAPQLTLREIGEAFGLSRERIRQIESVALEKLQRIYAGTTLAHYVS